MKLYIFELEFHSMVQEHSRKTQKATKTKKPKTTTISQKSKPTINETPKKQKTKNKNPASSTRSTEEKPRAVAKAVVTKKAMPITDSYFIYLLNFPLSQHYL